MDTTDREDVRIELAVRSLGVSGRQTQQDSAIERLESLEAEGAVASFDVSVWGKQVELDGVSARTRPGQAILDSVDRFQEWADRNDYSIGTFIETKRIQSEMTGEDYRALELPTMVLAEYRDDDLVWMSPCLDPDTGTVYTVRDRIEMLEAGEVDLAQTTAQTRPPLVQEE